MMARYLTRSPEPEYHSIRNFRIGPKIYFGCCSQSPVLPIHLSKLGFITAVVCCPGHEPPTDPRSKGHLGIRQTPVIRFPAPECRQGPVRATESADRAPAWAKDAEIAPPVLAPPLVTASGLCREGAQCSDLLNIGPRWASDGQSLPAPTPCFFGRNRGGNLGHDSGQASDRPISAGWL